MKSLPWKVSHEFICDRGDVYGVDDADGMPVIPKLNVDREVMQLIAAAPDLLKALEAITEMAERCDSWESFPLAPIEVANAAISKATRGTS